MLLILLSWIIIAYISFTIGFATRRIFIVADSKGTVATHILWGFFVISTASTALLFYTPTGPGVLALFALTALGLHVRFKDDIHRSLARLTENFRSARDKIFAGVLLICLLALSAQSSKINDDGYYYIQTMLWFSDVGFVKGISNLLLPLGLASSWHVLQAIFSFDFLDGLRLNDVNGLLVFIFYIFCVERGLTKKQNTFLMLLLSAGLLISIPFLSAPSPDLPVILLTVMSFYLASSGLDRSTVTDIFIFAGFAATIKLSSVALILLAVAIMVFPSRNKQLSTRLLVSLVVVGALTVAKNIYQTGYPFFPYPWFGVSSFPWTTPFDVIQYYAHEIKSWGLEGKIYRGPASELRDIGIWETLRLLWGQSGLKGIMNKFLLISFPLIVLTLLQDLRHRMVNKSDVTTQAALVTIFAINFFIWLLFAPQYRFILPAYLFFGTWALWILVKQPAWNITPHGIKYTPHAALMLILLVTVLPISLNLISTSSHIGRTDGFQLKWAVTPHISYSFSGIDTLQVNGQAYFHVQGNGYCWDSPRPCMSAFQRKFLHSLGYDLRRKTDDHFILVQSKDAAR